MKLTFKKLLKTVLAVATLGGVVATMQPVTAQAGPADDLIAIYLGSIMLNTGTDISALTNEQQAAALITGRNAFRSNVKRTQPLAVGATIPGGSIQSTAFQAAVLQATELALSNPTNITIARTAVALDNGRSANVAATLNPARVRSSQIVAFIIRRMPNMAPLLAQQGTAAAFLGGSTPTFNYRGKTPEAIALAQVRDAARLAAANLRAGLRGYPRGTVNVPADQLVDFRVVSNQVLLAKYTAGIAANAIMALPDDIDLEGSNLVYDRAVSLMTNSLVKAANSLMRMNANSIPGVALGGVYAVTGIGNSLWNDTSTDEAAAVTAALNGVAVGAITAGKKFSAQIAYNLAAAFAATFMANGGDESEFDTNRLANSTALYNVIAFALKKVSATLETQIREQIEAGFDVGLDEQARLNIPGHDGINDFLYANSQPSPVTDIVGF